jgi:hypothetical protein
MFTIIFDHPKAAPAVRLFHELEARYSASPMVRLRLQDSNHGANAARYRGLDESSADWVLFLDADVVPEADVLGRYAGTFRANPKAARFVGTSLLPPPRTSTQAAVHIANISYFWTIARGPPDETELPRGVTANLLVRRQLGVLTRFRTTFPKTGGGEDIDFCLRVRSLHAELEPNGAGWVAAPSAVMDHPWWDGERCRYNHFLGWSRGDGPADRPVPGDPHLPQSARLGGGYGNPCIRWVDPDDRLGALTQASNFLPSSVAQLLSHMVGPEAIATTMIIAAGCLLGDIVYEADFGTPVWAMRSSGFGGVGTSRRSRTTKAIRCSKRSLDC